MGSGLPLFSRLLNYRSRNAFCSLCELGWVLFKSSWAASAAEKVSLALVIGVHLSLGSIGDVNLIVPHNRAMNGLWGLGFCFNLFIRFLSKRGTCNNYESDGENLLHNSIVRNAP